MSQNIIGNIVSIAEHVLKAGSANLFAPSVDFIIHVANHNQ